MNCFGRKEVARGNLKRRFEAVTGQTFREQLAITKLGKAKEEKERLNRDDRDRLAQLQKAVDGREAELAEIESLILFLVDPEDPRNWMDAETHWRACKRYRD